MKRYRVLVGVMLVAMALIAGCTSSDETVDETTTAAPATTVAPPETATTAATTTSTTLSPAAAIATVEAFINARNAHDADAFAAFLAESAWTGEDSARETSHSWEQSLVAFDELVGWQGTLSGCDTDDGLVTCLVTAEDTLISGKAGVVYTFEYEFRFDAQGLIKYGQARILTGDDEYSAFDDALGLWMMTAYPESFPTFYLVDDSEALQEMIERTGKVYWRKENWSTPEGVAELSPLIDEFVAQSDEYPLWETATTAPTTTTTATTTVATELRLTFDGGSCTYEGPTELQTGPVELIYDNESDEWSAMNFVILDEGYTVQDVIDQLGPQPSMRHAPSWTKAMGDFEAVAAGGTLSWRFDLEPGVYTMVCARQRPRQGWEGWLGTGLTVEE